MEKFLFKNKMCFRVGGEFQQGVPEGKLMAWSDVRTVTIR